MKQSFNGFSKPSKNKPSSKSTSGIVENIQNIYYGLSTSQTLSGVLSLPNLIKIDSITSDTGVVNYSLDSNNNITITASNGNVVNSVYNTYQNSMVANSSQGVAINQYEKWNGSSWQVSSTIFSPSTYQNSVPYNSGGYTGSLAYLGATDESTTNSTMPSNPTTNQIALASTTTFTALYSGTVYETVGYYTYYYAYNIILKYFIKNKLYRRSLLC